MPQVVDNISPIPTPEVKFGVFWCNFFVFPPWFAYLSLANFVIIPHNLSKNFLFFAMPVIFAVQCAIFSIVIPCNLYTPYRLIGRIWIFIIDFIPALILSAWHHFLVVKHGGLSLEEIYASNFGPLCLVLAITGLFYLFVYYMHLAYDIGALDVILGYAMQALCFLTCGPLVARILALSLCLYLSIFRYMIYTAPDVLPHPQRLESQESQQSPC